MGTGSRAEVDGSYYAALALGFDLEEEGEKEGKEEQREDEKLEACDYLLEEDKHGDEKQHDCGKANYAGEKSDACSENARSIGDVAWQLKLVLPNSLSGTIIGKNGENLVNICKSTGAFVQASAPGSCVEKSRDRLFIIAGKSAHQCLEAFQEILASVANQKKLDRLSSSGSFQGLVLRQVIPGSSAGYILGIKGQKIAEISRRHGMRISIVSKPENASMAPFRIVKYSARSSESLVAGLTDICEILEQDGRYATDIKKIKSVVLKVVKTSEKGLGALIGQNGINIRVLEDVLRCKMTISRNANDLGEAYVTIWGQPENVRVASEIVSLHARDTGGKNSKSN